MNLGAVAQEIADKIWEDGNERIADCFCDSNNDLEHLFEKHCPEFDDDTLYEKLWSSDEVQYVISELRTVAQIREQEAESAAKVDRYEFSQRDFI